MANEHTFVVNKKCPVCGMETPVIKVRSRLATLGVDNDYCCHYRGINQYLYHIWVCEHCGFAADEKTFLSVLPERHKNAVSKFLQEKKVHFIFNEERSVPDGLASLQLALYCAEAMNTSLARQAGMTLRMAWIYRMEKNQEKEREYMEKALHLYERSLYTERYPSDNLTDNMVMYLIGVTYSRLGNKEMASQFISRLISDRSLKVNNSSLYKDAKTLWEDLRAEHKEEQKEN